MKLVIKKREIDARVGVLHDMSQVAVSDVTTAFFHEVMKHLVDGNEVHIPGFGTFRMTVRSGLQPSRTSLNRSSDYRGDSVGTTIVDVRRKYYVNFRRARAFRERFQDKYGKQKVVGRSEAKA